MLKLNILYKNYHNDQQEIWSILNEITTFQHILLTTSFLIFRGPNATFQIT